MARYQDAINWIADNDDTEFVRDAETSSDYLLSVTATLVRDLWDKTDDEILRDLRKAIRRLQ